MKIVSQNTVNLCLSCLLIFIPSFSFGQKLPTTQETGLKIADGVKIDGKSLEWNDTFQAYNKNTEVYYTIANNSDKIYLIFQVRDPNILNKLLSGGLTFTLKKSSNTNEKDIISITFPIIQLSNKVSIMKKIKDNDALTDTALSALNKEFTNSLKEIKVKGIKEITDTLISVYNDLGISAMSQFDNKKAITCELTIPLKFLQQYVDVNNQLNYNIRLNGLALHSISTVETTASGGQVLNINTSQLPSNTKTGIRELLNPTDFSAKYTLITK